MALNQVGLERLNTATTKKIGQSKNLIINGAMQVAQRQTSETGVAANGYSTVDRIQLQQNGTDAYPGTAQGTVASGTTPYTNGFRKTFKVTNGNQSSAGAADELAIRYSIEAQDVANSGWNYTSSSSNVTLSFWVKSSVAQNFYGYLLTLDGTMQRYAFETGSLSADTWTKVTKTIPGNSNITIDNNNGEGFRVEWRLFSGTDFTDSGVSLNTWAAFASGTRTPDYGSAMDDWYLTNNATFEITGVQLEIGSVATDFEHLSFADDLRKCQRYYYTAWKGSGNGDFVTGSDTQTACEIGSYSSSEVYFVPIFPVLMRDAPTLKQANVSGGLTVHRNAGTKTIDQGGWNAIIQAGKQAARVYCQTGSNRLSGNVSSGEPYPLKMTAAGVYMAFDAEL